ncbi:ECF transporter S component [Garciella nitratireducens]|uniref:Uncharacterized membrane protein n=1 Tax=Garciella nitratireducens DSM 15102 TaxID=1121911 RepID=A0A1T4L6V6_9FIRM|nr:ECF transporter S component [Garciella nitratireducens]RBP38464.1 putative membrane protein [Garciella nitratireducens]SJZ50449.1 Uncharacterized membrane protein [Garciella nitratireducens DSM 15102]
MQIKTRTITLTGMLAAISIVLGVTPLGLIPVPTVAGRATIMHIPVIVGAILEGPIVGMIVGFIFGLISFITTGSPLIKNPIIAIIPRILIGLFSYYGYKWTKSSIVAAIIGSLTNTIGVMGLAVLFRLTPMVAALGVVFTQGIPEAIVGAIITAVVVKPLKNIYGIKKISGSR